MTTDYKRLAAVDITYFKLAYPEACPNCGVKWDDFPPLANLYPHWTGGCKETVVIRDNEFFTAFPPKPKPWWKRLWEWVKKVVD